MTKDGDMVRYLQILASLVLLCPGCASPFRPASPAEEVRPASVEQAYRLPAVESEIQLVGYSQAPAKMVAQPVVRAAQNMIAEEVASPEPMPPRPLDDLAPLGVLDVDRLAEEVISRNPSVQAMIAAWQAAAERYPQVIALDDPMLGANVGPGSWGSSQVKSAYMLMLSQKIPWPGKRQLQADIAGSKADEEASQIEMIQLELAEMAKLAFYDYYAAYRELALNGENLKETREFRDTAEAKLRASLVTQQDVLQAEVELALLERRRNELQRQVKIAVARINTLLHRDAVTALPPPPEDLDLSIPVPSVLELRSIAAQRRPELAALTAQIQADESTVALAWKEFYPDMEVYAKYDAFWQEDPLRSAVGLNVNVPFNKSRRYAAVREAEARLRQHRAAYDRLSDEITNEIHASYERLKETHLTAQLFSDRILPAAKQNVESARAGYVAGTVDFLRLIEAQRQLITLREQQVESNSDYHRRLTELKRAAALPLEMPPTLNE